MSMLSKTITEIKIRALMKKREGAEAALAAMRSAKTSEKRWMEYNERDSHDINRCMVEFDANIKHLEAEVTRLTQKEDIELAEYKEKQD